MYRDFLLKDRLAKKLYNEVASELPIIDYHNHLSKADIISNRKFENITQMWITPDPYKHRVMRIHGVPEKFITGDATDREKFDKFCEVFPELVGSPVYDFSMLELTLIFETDIKPCAENADKLWNELNAKLALDENSVLGIMKRFKVEYAAPCASVCEDVSAYEDDKIFAPSLRGDDMVVPTLEFVSMLSSVTGIQIDSLADYYTALFIRFDELEKAGLIFTDHALDDGFKFDENTHGAEQLFTKILHTEPLSDTEKNILSSEILKSLACEYAKRDFVMQLHIGALRKTSTRLKNIAGPAGGFAGIGSDINISEVTRFLDAVEKSAGTLPKTILFTLNPAYNAALSILSGSYSRDDEGPLVSQGPAWWWCDHVYGIKEVLDNICAYSLLTGFVGMTTDSRSFLSFVRHDYFRRVLCAWIAEKVSRGELPDDYNVLKSIVAKLAYFNAKKTIDKRI